MSDDQSMPETLEILQIRAIAFCDQVRALESALELGETGVSFVEQEPPPAAHLNGQSVSTADESLAALVAGERLRTSCKGNEWCKPADSLSLKVMFYGNRLLSLADPVMSELEGHPSHEDGCQCARLSPLLDESIVPAIEESRQLLKATERLARNYRRQG